MRYLAVYITSLLLIIATSSADSEPDSKCTTPGERGCCAKLRKCIFLLNLQKRKPLLKENKKFVSRSLCTSSNVEAFFSYCGLYKNSLKTTTRGLLPKPGVCGNMLSNRVSHGSVANIDEFPWTALILYNEVDLRCGGSLIHNRYVLTAAHCLSSKGRKAVMVRLGEWDISTDHDCQKNVQGLLTCTNGHVDVPIETITPHYKYAPTPKSVIVPHDIGLIRLSRNVVYTDFIRPICLPIKASLKETSLYGMALDIAGWGLTEAGRSSSIKRKAVVDEVSLSGCQRLYRKVYTSQLCAGGRRGVGTCRGDSGGALVASDTSDMTQPYYYIAGIIAFGKDICGLHGWPGVFTKVIDYVDWIQENIHP